MSDILPEFDVPHVPSTPQVVVNVEQTLRFLDEKLPYLGNHATAIVSVLGEDLAAASYAALPPGQRSHQRQHPNRNGGYGKTSRATARPLD